jgi:phosphoadenosine phosphosulfate reductase
MDTPMSLPRAGAALDELNQELETLPLDAFLDWSLAVFGERIAHVTSFGPSGLVILDHLLHSKPALRVLSIDTDFLFTETYILWEQIEKHYGISIEAVRTPISPSEQDRQFGPALWETHPDACCNLRKVKPMAVALVGLDAWYTGIRRDQGGARASTRLVAWDTRYDLFKLSPLATWTREQVWDYIRRHDLPYNSLHDRGYTSIGCTHCTRPPVQGDGERSGRWAGQAKTECGLHWTAPVHTERNP